MKPYELIRTNQRTTVGASDADDQDEQVFSEERPLFVVCAIPYDVLPHGDGWGQFQHGVLLATFKLNEVVWMLR